MIKIQCAHISKSYLKFQHVPELSHSVHRGINPSSCEAPLFRQFPIYNCFFVTPSPKNWGTPIILTSLIFNPSYLLKVTKFLVKICQFKFLVVEDKYYFVYKFFYHLKLQILVYFLYKNCNPSSCWKKSPLFSSNLPLKIEILSSPFFSKFGRRFNSPAERKSGECTRCQ